MTRKPIVGKTKPIVILTRTAYCLYFKTKETKFIKFVYYNNLNEYWTRECLRFEMDIL